MDGKHHRPQILIGLLVSGQGYPIGYELFEGNTSEANTLLPALEFWQGRLSNTTMSKYQVITNFQHLWQIGKAFCISRTDLWIRPFYLRLKSRIKAHICICFAAYAEFKELERLLIINEVGLSPQKAIEEIKK